MARTTCTPLRRRSKGIAENVSAVEPPLAVARTLFHEVAFYALFLLLILNLRAMVFGPR